MKRVTGILLGLMLVAAACSSSSGSKALSKEDFLKQGNEICKKGNAALDAAGQAAFGSSSEQPDPATLTKFIKETVAPNVKKQLDDIDALTPPKELQADVDKLLKDARAALAKLQETADKDPASIFNGNDPFADVNASATKIGLTDCASSDSGGGGSSSSS